MTRCPLPSFPESAFFSQMSRKLYPLSSQMTHTTHSTRQEENEWNELLIGFWVRPQDTVLSLLLSLGNGTIMWMESMRKERKFNAWVPGMNLLVFFLPFTLSIRDCIIIIFLLIWIPAEHIAWNTKNMREVNHGRQRKSFPSSFVFF